MNPDSTFCAGCNRLADDHGFCRQCWVDAPAPLSVELHHAIARFAEEPTEGTLLDVFRAEAWMAKSLTRRVAA